MRKVLLLAASALLVPGVALADGEEVSPTGWFGGVQAGWTEMNMPEHTNGTFYMDFGGGYEAFPLTADVDGMSYGVGIGKDLSSGWRVGAYARFFDGDGEASGAFAIPNLTPFRRGTLDGTLQLAGNYGGASTAAQKLEVDVTDYAVAASVGHGLGDILHADLVASYGAKDTEYRNNIHVTGPGFTEDWKNSTTFSSNTVEIAARLSAGFGLSEDLSVNVGGSAGWGLANIDMNASQQYIQNVTVLSSSTLGVDDDVDGFVGRAEATLNYSIARSTMIGVNVSYVYDELTPVYVPPVYGTSAAGFSTEGQSSMTYGLRLVGRL